MAGERNVLSMLIRLAKGLGIDDDRLFSLPRDTVGATCDADARRGVRVVEGDTGVADQLSICLKDDTDAHVWGTIATLADIPGVTTAFSDDDFGVYNEADNTKIAEFDASGITTGTTRTYDLPDADGTLALVASTFKAVNIRTNSANLGTGTNDSVTATCSVGELLVGCAGGVSLGGGVVQVIRTSTTATTCTVVGRNDSGSVRTLTAEAICIS